MHLVSNRSVKRIKSFLFARVFSTKEQAKKKIICLQKVCKEKYLKSTVSIRFIDTGKRFTGKECQRNFNILFVNNLIKKTFPTHI